MILLASLLTYNYWANQINEVRGLEFAGHIARMSKQGTKFSVGIL
jgi:hypothetical protein